MIEGDGKPETVTGTARIFVLPADDSRTERLAEVRNWIADKNGDEQWKADVNSADVKVLVLSIGWQRGASASLIYTPR